jgi:hypothetical protein
MSEAVQAKLAALQQQGATVIDEKTRPKEIPLLEIQPDVMTADMSNLRYVHRTTADSEIYWLNNRAAAARTCDVSFRVSGLEPTLWHPETGEIEEVSYEMSDTETTVHLDMLPEDAFFVVFQRIS